MTRVRLTYQTKLNKTFLGGNTMLNKRNLTALLFGLTMVVAAGFATPEPAEAGTGRVAHIYTFDVWYCNPNGGSWFKAGTYFATWYPNYGWSASGIASVNNSLRYQGYQTWIGNQRFYRTTYNG